MNLEARLQVPDDVPEESRDAYLKGMRRLGSRFKGVLGVAINCWHMNDHESAAMWKLYPTLGLASFKSAERVPQVTKSPHKGL